MDTQALARQVTAEVRKAMEARGISQRDLAARTGLPLVTLSRRLTGTGKPFDIAELLAVAEAVDVSFVDLALRAERAVSTVTSHAA